VFVSQDHFHRGVGHGHLRDPGLLRAGGCRLLRRDPFLEVADLVAHVGDRDCLIVQQRLRLLRVLDADAVDDGRDACVVPHGRSLHALRRGADRSGDRVSGDLPRCAQLGSLLIPARHVPTIGGGPFTAFAVGLVCDSAEGHGASTT
jgi:hypothetical protein